MPDLQILHGFATSFARELGQAEPLAVRLTPLRGGLEAPGVVRVTASGHNFGSISFVIKHLQGDDRREAAVYRRLERSSLKIAPRLLGLHSTGQDGYMCLEWVPQRLRWPWRDASVASLVVQRLASLHEQLQPEPPTGSEWDYEGQLAGSAMKTVEDYARLRLPGLRPMTLTLERLAGELGAIRTELFRTTGVAMIHGDAHPGNAMIRNQGGLPRAVLIDWGRARSGSALEDLASWLQSLSFWEPVARRDHDRYLREYRIARGWTERPGRDFRDLYWLAAASNAFAGALSYHLAVVWDMNRPARQRECSRRAVADWLRMVRRAGECWHAGGR